MVLLSTTCGMQPDTSVCTIARKARMYVGELFEAAIVEGVTEADRLRLAGKRSQRPVGYLRKGSRVWMLNFKRDL